MSIKSLRDQIEEAKNGVKKERKKTVNQFESRYKNVMDELLFYSKEEILNLIDEIYYSPEFDKKKDLMFSLRDRLQHVKHGCEILKRPRNKEEIVNESVSNIETSKDEQ